MNLSRFPQHSPATRAVTTRLGIVVVAALAVVPVAAEAQAAQSTQPAARSQASDDRASPERVVQVAVEGVLRAIQSDPATRSGDLAKITEVVKRDFVPHTDFSRTTRLAVGAPWQSATPVQRQALVEQFRAMMVRTYAVSLSQLREQQVSFSFKAAPVGSNADDAVVASRLLDGAGDTQVDYRLRRGPDGWKIYDINMMGAWMADIYRRQFADILARGGIDGLIQHLTTHNARQNS